MVGLVSGLLPVRGHGGHIWKSGGRGCKGRYAYVRLRVEGSESNMPLRAMGRGSRITYQATFFRSPLISAHMVGLVLCGEQLAHEEANYNSRARGGAVSDFWDTKGSGRKLASRRHVAR